MFNQVEKLVDVRPIEAYLDEIYSLAYQKLSYTTAFILQVLSSQLY